MSASFTADAGEMEVLQEELEHFSRDLAYYSRHYEELLMQYPGKWVAIYGERVVGTGEDRGTLAQGLRKRGIPPEHSLFGNPSAEQETCII
jgi:hypothetical protein